MLFHLIATSSNTSIFAGYILATDNFEKINTKKDKLTEEADKEVSDRQFKEACPFHAAQHIPSREYYVISVEEWDEEFERRCNR